MNKPSEFDTHPVSFQQAMREGLFRGVVKKLHDADTAAILTDLGFAVFLCPDIRITDSLGFNAFEVVGVEKAQGLAAKEAAMALALDKPVVFSTLLTSVGSLTISFDRVVADVWVVAPNGARIDMAIALRAQGFDKLHPVTL